MTLTIHLNLDIYTIIIQPKLSQPQACLRPCLQDKRLSLAALRCSYLKAFRGNGDNAGSPTLATWRHDDVMKWQVAWPELTRRGYLYPSFVVACSAVNAHCPLAQWHTSILYVRSTVGSQVTGSKVYRWPTSPPNPLTVSLPRQIFRTVKIQPPPPLEEKISKDNPPQRPILNLFFKSYVSTFFLNRKL